MKTVVIKGFKAEVPKPYGSFPKQGDANVDLRMLWSLLLGPTKRYP